jgi:hypothetical protein
VAYGADAKATVDLVRASGIRVVMSNCEEALSTGAADCGCGFAPGSACDRLSAAWFAHADRQLDADARVWTASLPRRLCCDHRPDPGCRPRQLDRNQPLCVRLTPVRVKALDLALSGADGMIAGHCGLPFTQVIEGRLWHNPGVIGLPANDGIPRVWFSVLTPGPEPRTLVVEHRALEYDHGTAAAKIRAAGLPNDYAAERCGPTWVQETEKGTETARAGRRKRLSREERERASSLRQCLSVEGSVRKSAAQIGEQLPAYDRKNGRTGELVSKIASRFVAEGLAELAPGPRGVLAGS